MGFENPQSSQTGGDYGDRSLTAASAASFNLRLDEEGDSLATLTAKTVPIPIVGSTGFGLAIAGAVVYDPQNRTGNGLSRRNFLYLGLGVAGLSLADVLRLQARARTAHKAVVMVVLQGLTCCLTDRA